jgi:serine protease Do
MAAAFPGFGDIAEELRRVTVQVLDRGNNGVGSGVIAGPFTLITNAHVASGAQARVRLASGQLVRATVQKRDRARDLAMLHAPEIPVGTPLGTLREAASLRPGEIAIAVGHPMGFIGAVSTGVIRAVGPVPGLGRHPWVHASVRLAPGNSGGPLADVRGQIAGINTMVIGGVGLAIPSEAVQKFLVAPAPLHLGVTVRPARLADGTQGLLILQMEADGPAAAASLFPGDLITGIDGATATGVDSLEAALTEAAAGRRSTVTVHFRRGGSDRERHATATAQGPDYAEHAA